MPLSSKVQPEGGIQEFLEYEKEDAKYPALARTSFGMKRSNPLRKMCIQVMRHKVFDAVIMFFIITNSIVMAMSDYRVKCLGRNDQTGTFGQPDPSRCWQNTFGDFTNRWVFGVVFIVELVIKMIAMGPLFGENTYFKDAWCWLDFVCVLAYIVGQLGLNMGGLMGIKALRLLRPLKSVNKFPALKKIVVAFMAAFDGLGVTVMLLTFLLFVVSIACMQFFKGAMHYRCRITPYPTRVPDTWYVNPGTCPSNSNRGRDAIPCIKKEYYPFLDDDDGEDTEFEIYEALMTMIAIEVEAGNVDAAGKITATAEITSLLSDAAALANPWPISQTDPAQLTVDTWACTDDPKFPGPRGLPVLDTYPAQHYANYDDDGGGLGSSDPEQAKFWDTPKRCLWLVDRDDEGRPCASSSNEIFGMGGMHKCYNRETQRAMGGKSSYCGSNYDPFGQRRFEKAPIVGQGVYLAQCDPEAGPNSAAEEGEEGCDTVPIQLDNWSRFSTGLFKSLYPEFTGDLNFGYTNFDNLGSAMVTLFQAVTMEGWTIIMYHMMDAAWPAISVFLFLTLFAVGSMLVLNLVLGVIADALGDEEDAEMEAEAEKTLQAEEENGVPEPEAEEPKIPYEDTITSDLCGYRLLLYKFVTSDLFTAFIYVAILVNTVVLVVDDYPKPPEFSQAMSLCNFALAVIFLVEMVLKWVAMGWTYFEDPFNNFDCAIVWISILTMVCAALNLGFGGGAISAFRCFRVFRLLKVLKTCLPNLMVLLSTVGETAREIAPFLVLLSLMVFIFGLLGMMFFANQLRFDGNTDAKIAFSVYDHIDTTKGRMKVDAAWGETGRDSTKVSKVWLDAAPGLDLGWGSFDDFCISMVAVFGILTGESWNAVMYDLMRGATSPYLGLVYMLATIIILAFFVMNMFLAILLKNFEDNDELSASDGPSPFLRMKTLLSVTAAFKSGKKEGEEEVTTEIKESRDKSLNLFTPDNAFRKKCAELAANPTFDKVIITCILIGALTMACQTPLMDPAMPIIFFFKVLDYVFAFIFLVECLAKVVAFGFLCNGSGSYLKDSWNILDFVIVVVSILMLLGDLQIPLGVDVKVFRVLRVARVFRPLRMMTRYPGLKLVLNSLICAIPGAFNVMIVCILIMVIFAILGQGFFKGTMGMCDLEDAEDWQALLVSHPISLSDAIKDHGSGSIFDLVNEYAKNDLDDVQPNTQCWVTWDEAWINKHSYFNPKTEVTSDVVADWENGGRPIFVGGGYDNDVEGPKAGYSKATRDYFAANPLGVTALDADLAKAGGNLDDFVPTSKDMCRCLFQAEGAWSVDGGYYMTFDNTAQAFLLLVEIYSTEGWLDYMYYNADKNGVEMQPFSTGTKYGRAAGRSTTGVDISGAGNSDHGGSDARTFPRFYSFFFHVMFQFIGGFFAMQLFVGIIIEQFATLKEQAEHEGRSGALMTASQEQWVKTSAFIMQQVKPKKKTREGPVKLFFKVVESENKVKFEGFIMFCICANGVVMGIDYYGASTGYVATLEVLNLIFALVFGVEAVLKIGGIGWTQYWCEGWNRFDFVIVIGTFLGYIVSDPTVSSTDVGGVVSIVRLLRIARIFRLMNSAKTLKTLVNTLLSALPQMMNVGLVLMIFVLIFAILLVEQFAHVGYAGDVHQISNFQHVPVAILTLIKFTTGENWNGYMHDLNENWRDGSGCWSKKKFNQIKTKMYEAEPGSMFESGPGYWEEKWCTRGDGGDRPTCPCAGEMAGSLYTEGFGYLRGGAGGAVQDTCQAFEHYEDCCVPLNGCGDEWWAGFIIRIFDILVTGVVLNLFVGIILSAYDDEDEETGLGLSDADLDNFVDDWARFDAHATWLLPVADLKDFMQVLDEPMGFGEAYAATDVELEAEILKLKLRVRHANLNEGNFGESKLHMFDVATALGKRVVAKVAEAEGGDSLLDEGPTSAENETSVDATPHLQKLFASQK